MWCLPRAMSLHYYTLTCNIFKCISYLVKSTLISAVMQTLRLSKLQFELQIYFRHWDAAHFMKVISDCHSTETPLVTLACVAWWGVIPCYSERTFLFTSRPAVRIYNFLRLALRILLCFIH